MPRKLSKWIVALVSSLLIVLYAALGVSSNLLAGHTGFSKFFNDRPWFNLVLLIAGLILLIVLLSAWQHGRSKEPATREDLEAATRTMLEGFRESARQQGLIAAQSDQDKDTEITRLTQELKKLQKEAAARSSEPPEAELSKLLAARDLDGALRLKSQQVQARRAESARLPRDLYELGTIHELRFEWPQALAAFREAWELGHEPDHGFKYAHFAQKLNRFSEAITAYEALLRVYTDAAHRAGTLNNLATLYRDTQRMQEAEQAFSNALLTFRRLAEANPDPYLPDVAMTLNNLANLYSDTQRMKDAERAYTEALAIRRKLAEANPDAYLLDVATTLNNLAVLYRNTQRMKDAEHAQLEALGLRRRLATSNPGVYLPDVATSLKNLANLFVETQRVGDAERAYSEALNIRRWLAEANPDSFLVKVAATLNNLANLLSSSQRVEEAEQAFAEALFIYRKLAEASPNAYQPYVAATLNNLAALYNVTQRMKEAEQAFAEALALYHDLAGANPDAYLPDVAMTLNNLAILCLLTEKTEEAQTDAAEAERILDPFWQANPELHGDQMSRTLWTRAHVAEASHEPTPEACRLARRALAAAYDPGLRICPKTSEGTS